MNLVHINRAARIAELTVAITLAIAVSAIVLTVLVQS
jgi:hypothetical protein